MLLGGRGRGLGRAPPEPERPLPEPLSSPLRRLGLLSAATFPGHRLHRKPSSEQTPQVGAAGPGDPQPTAVMCSGCGQGLCLDCPKETDHSFGSKLVAAEMRRLLLLFMEPGSPSRGSAASPCVPAVVSGQHSLRARVFGDDWGWQHVNPALMMSWLHWGT